ncbi:CAP domain-containing protein [Nonomuraea sp. PA05]|uniref:CAP domain-containing protein n=1 Tax=Nonomuraea sp. PA05 TaxID=2604466 RepID=UPI0011D4AE73|nr:CAP domain-containing protein [Nonomuraea sp. PA05]TYB56039.1 CAP domain-containing protein [Nonomuraea sp. PA05]
MRKPLGALAAVLSLAACGPSPAELQAAPTVSAPAEEPAPTSTPIPTPEPDDCRVSVAAPAITARTIQTSAVRRECTRPALLRVRIKRAVPGEDPVVKSGAVREDRITLKMPCKAGTYYAVATDYRSRAATSKAVRLTCPAPKPTPTPTPSASRTPAPAATAKKPAETASSVGSALEREVVRLTNAERAKGGCRALTHDAKLRRAAFGHSADMAENDYFDHDSQDGRDMMDRIRATGFGGSAWAENIAMGQRSAAAVVRDWMNSDGHRQNIMNCSYTHIGVGAAKDAKGQIYWTQDFGAR